MAGREGVKHHGARPSYPAHLNSQSQQGAHLHLSNIQHFCMGSAPSHKVVEGKGTRLFQRENQGLWENKVQMGEGSEGKPRWDFPHSWSLIQISHKGLSSANFPVLQTRLGLAINFSMGLI